MTENAVIVYNKKVEFFQPQNFYGEIKKMKVIITENYDEMSKKAAEIIIDLVKKNPNAILGLATGSSPIGTYKYMIEDYKKRWRVL